MGERPEARLPRTGRQVQELEHVLARLRRCHEREADERRYDYEPAIHHNLVPKVRKSSDMSAVSVVFFVGYSQREFS